MRAKLQENLVTRHTASVGVLLQSSPLDAAKTEQHEVPLQVGSATQSGALCVVADAIALAMLAITLYPCR